MSLLFDSFWRAVAYCMHPRVIALSFLPLVLMVVLSFGLGYFFWEPAVAGVTAWFEAFELVQAFLSWLDRVGLGTLRTVFAPLVVLVLATPAIVVLCLLLVSLFMTPAMVDLVARRRFGTLERRQGGSMVASVLWSTGSTLLALVALVLSVPAWFIPPLVLILPPLIWGWLTYRVFAFDALATHASAEERKQIMKTHRGPLLLMGVLSGYLGAAPSLPAAYNAAVHGLAIGPKAGSCGTAAWRGEPVVVTDIDTDPLWEDYRGLAAAHGPAVAHRDDPGNRRERAPVERRD